MEIQPEEGNELATPVSHPTKRRKRKSMVWEHFTIETVSPGCRRAYCNTCKQSFAYSTGSKVAGTSHLKRHVAKGACLALVRGQANNENQLAPYTPKSDITRKRYRSPSSPYSLFDLDRCRQDIAKMIIMHEYPLHIVEHPGFVAFVQNLQPRFEGLSFRMVQGDCVAMYLSEKHSVMKYIEGIPGRVCLTMDLWTSNQTLGYVLITGHFIDGDWKLQRRLLNVVMEPYPDSETALSHAVACCISDWGLEGKLLSVTFSNPVDKPGLENLRPLLSIKNPHCLDGQFLIGNCVASTLSTIAKDVFDAGNEIIQKVRDSVKHVMTSKSHEEKFLELKHQLQVPTEKVLSLDDDTQWNTTYEMLVAASELKEVFSCLDTSDPDYKQALDMEDWNQVETLCSFLKPLYDSACILTSMARPASVTFFHEMWRIKSDLVRASASEDHFISNIARTVQEKVNKYWKDCGLILAMAVVMDPRFKMKLVEFSFPKIYGENSPVCVKLVDDGIHELFLEYASLPLPLTPAYADHENGQNNSKTDGLSDFDMFIMETTGQHLKSELDQYLDEALLPRVQEFDVLDWWKQNRTKYPTLSRMARDVLSIPVSTMAPEAVFETEPKKMDSYKSSLRPETVEALMCAKDWLLARSEDVSNALVKMEIQSV